MKYTELGFNLSGGVLRWQAEGIVHVVPLDKRGVPHSYCEICVLGLEEPDPCVICYLAWHKTDLLILPSWDLNSNTIPNLSSPSTEIPAKAAEILISMREARAVYQWIKNIDGRTPPIRIWLAAVLACWAKDFHAAVAAINEYLGCKVGPDLLDEAKRIKEIIEAKGAEES